MDSNQNQIETYWQRRIKNKIMNRLLIEGIVTTLIGVLILIACFYMWLTGKATQNESYLMAGLGLLFLRSKDSLIGLSNKKHKNWYTVIKIW